MYFCTLLKYRPSCTATVLAFWRAACGRLRCRRSRCGHPSLGAWAAYEKSRYDALRAEYEAFKGG